MTAVILWYSLSTVSKANWQKRSKFKKKKIAENTKVCFASHK